jgi:cell division septum initiation protein DivIVA
MINKSDDIIASLRNNLKQIINLYENQKEENKILKQKNGELIHQISLLTKEKETLKNKNDNTDLKNAFIEASGSNHEAKIKVNRIVREIDKCIALLNK